MNNKIIYLPSEVLGGRTKPTTPVILSLTQDLYGKNKNERKLYINEQQRTITG